MKYILSVQILVSGIISVTTVPCSPELCNGHGSCESEGSLSVPRRCECFHGWTGADCSLRSCFSNYAWSDVASSDESAHLFETCSNRGQCDESTGRCLCDEGFEGRACERMSCPNGCNGHGRCTTMINYSSSKDPGEGSVLIYEEPWDSMMTRGCICDAGYSGYDCSSRTCPSGDDPLTGTVSDPNGVQVNEQQRVTCTATSGSFTLSFRGLETSYIPFNADGLYVKNALENLHSINNGEGSSVEVTFDGVNVQACVASGHTWTVEFLTEWGDVPSLVPNSHKLVHSTSMSLVLDVQEWIKGDKENVPCSNRGICDTVTGQCMCEPEMSASSIFAPGGLRGDCGFESSVVTSCPGVPTCSGNGSCSESPTYTCICNAGWEGADCSLKSCPHGKSWFSRPVSSANDAHLAYAECSNAGTCDYSTGTCVCHSIFEGSSCSRLKCPTFNGLPCSGNGQCLTMFQLAAYGETEYGQYESYTYGSIPNNPLTWDWDMVQGCLCDEGYAGHNCTQRRCPTGDDPDTANQLNEVHQFMCTDSDGAGSFRFLFKKEETDYIYPTDTDVELEAALESLNEISDVAISCDAGTLCDISGTTCTIEYLTETGDLPELKVIFSSGISAISISESTKGSRENDECSHRGICNRETGECECFPGYSSSDGKLEPGFRGDCGYLMPYYASNDVN